MAVLFITFEVFPATNCLAISFSIEIFFNAKPFTHALLLFFTFTSEEAMCFSPGFRRSLCHRIRSELLYFGNNFLNSIHLYFTRTNCLICCIGCLLYLIKRHCNSLFTQEGIEALEIVAFFVGVASVSDAKGSFSATEGSGKSNRAARRPKLTALGLNVVVPHSGSSGVSGVAVSIGAEGR